MPKQEIYTIFWHHTAMLSHAKAHLLALFFPPAYHRESLDETSPATKADITTLMQQIGDYYGKTEGRFIKLEEHVDTQILAFEERMGNHMDTQIIASEKRMKEHFDVVAENIHYDMVGVHKDKISALEDTTKKHNDRIGILENRVGVY